MLHFLLFDIPMVIVILFTLSMVYEQFKDRYLTVEVCVKLLVCIIVSQIPIINLIAAIIMVDIILDKYGKKILIKLK